MIFGGAGDDIAIGGSGDDCVCLGMGFDTFVFMGAGGQDRVWDAELIYVAVDGTDTFADILAGAKAVDGGTEITFGRAGSIILADIEIEDLTADFFQFG